MSGNRRVSSSLSLLVLLIAALVLLGWLAGTDFSESVPGWKAMNPITACLLLMATANLFALQKRHRTTAIILALSITVAASLKMAAYYNLLNVSIDKILFSSSLEGNRMAPNTTISLFLSGLAFFFVSYRQRFVSISQLLMLVALVISMLALIGYLYALAVLYTLPSYLPMPMHTAFAIMLLSLAFLLNYSGSGFMSVIFDWKSGGTLARKFIPAAVLIPVSMGWVLINNNRFGIFNAESGIAVLVISIILVFSVMIWLQARMLNRADAERRKAEWELIRARKIAEDAKRVQEQFMTNMSHEIRTPMNGVIGMTNLLSRTSLNEQQREFVNTVRESSANLLAVLNDILDFNNISSGNFHFQQNNFRLSEVVSNVIRLNSFRAEEKGLQLSSEIEADADRVFNGDPARLSQILNNLIGNATKFTEKGFVNLKVSSVSNNGSTQTLRFRVIDSGIGISEETMKLIFNSYTQASAANSRKYGGSGLGLSITKQLVELQNGSISVQSKPGEGSTFTFEIPYLNGDPRVIEALQESEKLSDHAILSGTRILLVEDNKVNQKVAIYTLARWGAEVDLAEEGNAALELLRMNSYDLVLLDLQMPVMDGFETAVHIRSLPGKLKNIPIIAMTASALITEREKSMAVGMNDYISKPFMANDLRDKIRKVIPAKASVSGQEDPLKLGLDPSFA